MKTLAMILVQPVTDLLTGEIIMPRLEQDTQAFWLARLAWQRPKDFGDGWTVGELLQFVNGLAHKPKNLGQQSKTLLMEVVKNKTRRKGKKKNNVHYIVFVDMKTNPCSEQA